MTMSSEPVSRPDGVTLTAVWFIVNAIVPALGVAAILIFAFPAVIAETGGSDRYFAVAGVSFGMLVLLVLVALNVTAAVGLFGLKPWARILSIVLAALGLIWFPVGTAIGALIIWYMLGDEAKEAFGVAPPPAPPVEEEQTIKAA